MSTFATYTTRGTIGTMIAATLINFGGQGSQRANPSFDYDGKNFIQATGKSATVWSAKDGTFVRKLGDHEESVVRVQLSPDGSMVLTSSYLPPNELGLHSADNSLRLWDIASGKQVHYIAGATHGQFSRDGKRILGFTQRASTHPNEGGCDISSWDVQSGKKLFTVAVPGHGALPAYTFTLQESSDGTKVLFYQFRLATVFESSTGKQIGKSITLDRGGHGAFITPNGDEVQFAEFRYVSYYSVSSGHEVKRIPYPDETSWTIGWRADGHGFAGVNARGTVMTYNRKNDQLVSVQSEIQLPESVVFNASGNEFIVNWRELSGSQYLAQAFNFDTRKLAWTGRGRIVSISGSGEITSLDGTQLSVRNVASGKLIRDLHLKGSKG